MINEFDNHNGFLVEKGDKVFTSANRGFKYGDGIFETIKIANRNICLWDHHYKRLSNGLNVLQLESAAFSKEFFEKEIKKVVERNFYQHAKIRVFVFREAPGAYTPMSNRAGFFIEGVRYDQPYYENNRAGWSLGVYTEMQKSIDVTMNCKTMNALLYVMAGLWKKKNDFDDAVILNQNGKVAETTASNLFIINENVIYTPPLNSGPVEGTVRAQLFQLGFEIQEKELTLEDLNSSDEIFLTNAMMGVQPVKAFDNQSKEIEMSLKILEALENSILE